MKINCKLKIILIGLFVYLINGLFASPVFAQTPDYAPNFNPDVPRNQHTYAQSVMIEVISSAFCLVTGIDPINPQQGCLDIDPQTHKLALKPPSNGQPQVGGLIGVVPGMFTTVYTPPASSAETVHYLASHFGIVEPVMAQNPPCDPGGLQQANCTNAITPKNCPVGASTGDCAGNPVGFQMLSPLASLWTASRNITYMLLVMVFIIIGMAIILRVKIDPRTVMTLQNQIPRIIIAILLITFSYAIAGLMIDLMWVSTYTGINLVLNSNSTAAEQKVTAASPNGSNGITDINGLTSYINDSFPGLDGKGKNDNKQILINAIDKYCSDAKVQKQFKVYGSHTAYDLCISRVASQFNQFINQIYNDTQRHFVTKVLDSAAYVLSGLLAPPSSVTVNYPDFWQSNYLTQKNADKLVEVIGRKSFGGITYIQSPENPLACDLNSTIQGVAEKKLLDNPLNFVSNIFQGPNAVDNRCVGGIMRITYDVSNSIYKMVSGMINGFLTGNGAGAWSDLKCNANPIWWIWGGKDKEGAFAGCLAMALGWLGGFLVLFIILFVVIFLLFRVWFELLKAYVMVIIYVITAPFWILLGLLPSRPLGFEKWMRRMFANLVVFPAVALLLVTAAVLMNVFQSQSANGTYFVAPLLGRPDVNTLGSLIAFGMLLVTPGIINIIKSAVHAVGQQGQMASLAVTSSMAAGAAGPKGAGSGLYQRMFKYDPYTGHRGIGRRFFFGEIGSKRNRFMNFVVGTSEKKESTVIGPVDKTPPGGAQ